MDVSRRQVLRWGAGSVAVLAVGCSSGDDGADGGPRPSSTTTPVAPPAGPAVAMFASPSCGCCGEHAQYLRDNGYAVDLTRTDDLDAVRADHGVPDEAAGCHIALVDGYFVEGHVPVEAIDRLLAERPPVDGIALPGMPAGSPGMGDGGGPFEILAVTNGTLTPYTTA